MSLHAPGASSARSACTTKAAVGFEPHQAAVDHGDDEEPAVGQPAQPRRLLRHLDDRLGRAVDAHGDDPLVVLVGEPESAIVPAGTFGEHQAVENHCRRACAHGPDGTGQGGSVVDVVVARVCRAHVVEQARRRLREQGDEHERDEERADAHERDGSADPAELIARASPRGGDPWRSRARRGRRASRSTWSGPRWGRARRRGSRARCRPRRP